MDTHQTVKDYYGQVLKSSADLKTDACCAIGAMPGWIRPMLANIHPDVSNRFYGCGLVLPEALAGATVLDLGCGTGRDLYLLAQLVGAKGRVIGVDMTEEQLATARETAEWHRERFGYAEANTEVHQGYIEELGALPLAPGSVDVIVSNCVVNLSPDKAAVLAGAYRLLKPGGEIYFSDVYADRRIPEALRQDPVLYGECLTGALYWRDFERLTQEAGFARPRVVSGRDMSIDDPAAMAKLGDTRFRSVTYRLFKLSERPGEEDFGQTARYAGGLPGAEEALVLDRETVLPAGETVPLSAESYRILAESRLAPHVALNAGDGHHRGAFCAETPVTAGAACCG